MKKLILISLSLILALSTYSCKDDTDTDEGVTGLRITVQKQSDGTPYAGMRVYANLDSGGYTSDRVTGSDGIAEFKNIPPGIYSIYTSEANGNGGSIYSEFTVTEGSILSEIVLFP